LERSKAAWINGLGRFMESCGERFSPRLALGIAIKLLISYHSSVQHARKELMSGQRTLDRFLLLENFERGAFRVCSEGERVFFNDFQLLL
jgi:hypothetical protein